MKILLILIFLYSCSGEQTTNNPNGNGGKVIIYDETGNRVEYTLDGDKITKANKYVLDNTTLKQTILF